MTARLLALVRLLLAPPAPTEPARVPASRRRQARAAVGCGVAAYALIAAALSVVLDTARPGWRDPEYATRLDRVRAWKAAAPGRPLVLVFGSSRTQMGVAPAAMGLGDGPADPVVYNFGYRGAFPPRAWLQFARVLDAGVRPDFVLVQIAIGELGADGTAERLMRDWVPRFTPADLARVAPHADDPTALPRRWAAARLTGWVTYREAILGDLLPDWQPPAQRAQLAWEQIDPYGFTPHPGVPPNHDGAKRAREMRARHAPNKVARTIGAWTAEALEDVVRRCREAGIGVAFCWAPESPTYRGVHTPESRAPAEAFARKVADEWGVPVFPAPDHLFTDDDFVDGYHLRPHGAAKYSRWLADTHLKPWLAAHRR